MQALAVRETARPAGASGESGPGAGGGEPAAGHRPRAAHRLRRWQGRRQVPDEVWYAALEAGFAAVDAADGDHAPP